MRRRIKGRRPSPAMIVAGLALVLALAGTAVAGPIAIKSVLNKKEKKQVKSIAKNQVNQLAPGLSVAKAKTADNATTASNADTLDNLDSKQISPVASARRTANVALTDNYATVLTTSITAPAAGTLVANAAVYVISNGGNNDRADCRFVLDGTAGTSSVNDIPAGDATFPILQASAVGAGDHTVEIQCLKNIAGSVSLSDATIAVEFHL